MLIRPGELGCVSDGQPVAHLFLGIIDGVLRHVDPVDFNTRHYQREVIQQKALAAAHVKDLVTGLDPVVIGHRLGHLLPAARHVFVTTVVDATVTVPIVKIPLFGTLSSNSFWKVRIIHPSQIIALGAFVYNRKKINVSHNRIGLITF